MPPAKSRNLLPSTSSIIGAFWRAAKPALRYGTARYSGSRRSSRFGMAREFRFEVECFSWPSLFARCVETRSVQPMGGLVRLDENLFRFQILFHTPRS